MDFVGFRAIHSEGRGYKQQRHMGHELLGCLFRDLVQNGRSVKGVSVIEPLLLLRLKKGRRSASEEQIMIFVGARLRLQVGFLGY